MADNVVEVGDFSIARKGRIDRYDRQKCRHLRVELNDHGETVICSDCGVQVSAYWALNMVAERLSAEWSKLQRAKKQLSEDKSANLHLVAARVVEKAWRKRDLVPCCPHCGEGISPTDGFGNSLVSKRIDSARRAARAKAKQRESDHV
ncbi:TPA: hypothetical protein ACF4EW_002634 [Pseudomonas aeruginosa]